MATYNSRPGSYDASRRRPTSDSFLAVSRGVRFYLRILPWLSIIQISNVPLSSFPLADFFIVKDLPRERATMEVEKELGSDFPGAGINRGRSWTRQKSHGEGNTWLRFECGGQLLGTRCRPSDCISLYL